MAMWCIGLLLLWSEDFGFNFCVRRTKDLPHRLIDFDKTEQAFTWVETTTKQ